MIDVQAYINEAGLVEPFKRVIRQRVLGLEEAKSALLRQVEGDTGDEKFAWEVVQEVTKQSGAEGWCYNW